MNYVPLGEIVTIKGGGTPDKSNPDYWGGDIPWASVKDFKSNGIYQTSDHITALGVANSATNIVPAGSIIVPTRMAVGKAAINHIDLAINQDLKALFLSSRVETRYLLHALLAASKVLEDQATGATVKGITLDVLRGLNILLPPLAEQQRIAEILDQADVLRSKRRETLVQLSKLGESLFSSTFVDAAEAREWPVRCVGDLATDMRTGPFGSQLLHSEFVDQGVAVIGIDNAVRNEFVWDKRRYITQAKYETLSRYRVRPGDLLITIMGTCGRCAVVPDDVPLAINTKHICCISLDQNVVVPSFLHAAFLQHPEILQQLGLEAKGAVMPGLNMGIVKALKLPIPPVHLQKKFAAALKLIADEKQRCRQSLDHQDALFASLQHRAFRGEL